MVFLTDGLSVFSLLLLAGRRCLFPATIFSLYFYWLRERFHGYPRLVPKIILVAAGYHPAFISYARGW